jgi:hypothetical protein
LKQFADFYEIWQACDAIQGDHDAIIFNTIASDILKYLRYKTVRWMHQPCSSLVEIV